MNFWPKIKSPSIERKNIRLECLLWIIQCDCMDRYLFTFFAQKLFEIRCYHLCFIECGAQSKRQKKWDRKIFGVFAFMFYVDTWHSVVYEMMKCHEIVFRSSVGDLQLLLHPYNKLSAPTAHNLILFFCCLHNWMPLFLVNIHFYLYTLEFSLKSYDFFFSSMQ